MDTEYEDCIKHITTEYLRENPTHIFVFGDNTLGRGKKGAAIHRDEPNSYGFVTKKRPSYASSAYYRPKEYKGVFEKELTKLMGYIENNPELTFMISKLGAGLANQYQIYEKVIQPGLKILKKFDNVEFLFDIDGGGS